MTIVRGSVVCTGNVVYAESWVVVLGQHVRLTPQGVNLSGGQYELQWEFRADPGSTIVCSVDALDLITGSPCTTGTQTLAHGQTHIGSGQDKPPGYNTRVFGVSY